MLTGFIDKVWALGPDTTYEEAASILDDAKQNLGVDDIAYLGEEALAADAGELYTLISEYLGERGL